VEYVAQLVRVNRSKIQGHIYAVRMRLCINFGVELSLHHDSILPKQPATRFPF
jgi:hypothetical protein